MNEYDVKRLALVLAVQAEIEGMKVSNKQCEIEQQPLSHNEGAFQQQAERLRVLAYAHNEQL